MAWNGTSREYFWGHELSKENPAVEWTFEEEDDDSDFLTHNLFLRSAVLGSTAVEGERNIVQVETKNFAGDVVKIPLLSLTLGKKDMCCLDVNFHDETPATFRLIEGSGPVHISASHMVEFPDENDDLNDTEMTADTEEDELVQSKAKKRKATTPVTRTTKSKKGKLDASVEEGTEEEEEEDEELDEVDEESEAATEEEEEEEDDDEEDMDESEEEERKPEKVSKKKKAKASAPAVKPGRKTPKSASIKSRLDKSATKKGKKAGKA